MADRPYEGFLLVCDLDGTFLSPDLTLHPDNLQALGTFIDGGGRFAVATGRTSHSVDVNFPDLLSDLPGIFCNGAHLFDRTTRRTVHSQPLPPAAYELAQSLLDRFDGVGLEIFTDQGAFLIRSSEVLERQLSSEDLKNSCLKLEEIPGPWLKILLGASPEALIPVRAYLESCERTDISFVSSDSFLLDIMARGVSKGVALSWLLDSHSAEEGLSMTIAVGDNENDVDMLRLADLAFAPANGVQSARNAADAVLSHHSVPILPQILDFLRTHSV